ncbi:MAG: hypothetical protein JNM84_10885 [Planctomycetes bacterium]|nr:hypothetical protein [Planctomycetota bacterium]
MTEPVAEPRPRKPAWRRILSLCIWLVVLLALLLLLAPIAAQGRVREELVQALERGFDAEVELDRLELGWTSGIAIERLVVRPKQGGLPWLEVRRARFSPSLAPLLRSRLRWHDTILEDVVVRCERDAQGEFLPRWREVSSSEPRPARGTIEIDGDPFALDLDLKVEGLRVEMRDPEWPAPLVADFRRPIRLRSTGDLALRLEAELDERLQGRFDLALAKSTSAGAKATEYEPRGELHLVATGAPLELLEGLVAPWAESLRGRAHGSLHYQLSSASFAGGGTIHVQELELRSRAAGATPLPRALRFDSALSGTSAAAHHALRVEGAGIEADWTVACAGTDLAETALRGTLQPLAAASWLPQHAQLAIEGGALAFDARVEKAGLESFLCSGSLDTSRAIFYLGTAGRPLRGPGVLKTSGRFVPGAVPRVEDGRFEAVGIDARWSADAEKLSLDAQLDLDQLTTAWLENLGVGVLARGRGQLGLELARSEGPLPYVGALRFRGERFSTLAVEASDLRFDLALQEGGGIALRDGALGLNGGTVSFTAALAAPGSAARPFELALRASGVRAEQGLEFELARVLPLLAGAGSALQSALDIELDLRGDALEPAGLLRTLRGDGALAWKAATLRPSAALREPLALLGFTDALSLAALRAPFRVDAGAIALPPLALRAGGLELELTGRTALDGALDHTLGVKLPASASRALGVLLDSGGYLRLPLRGTTAAPRFEMPPLQNLVNQGLEGSLRRTLDDLLKRNTGRFGDVLDPRKKR